MALIQREAKTSFDLHLDCTKSEPAPLNCCEDRVTSYSKMKNFTKVRQSNDVTDEDHQPEKH